MSTPAGWQQPKTDWTDSPPSIPTKDDFNRIEGNQQATELGDRSLNQDLSPPFGLVGNLRQWLDRLVSLIKQIKGTANYDDDPPATLLEARRHMDSRTVHVPLGSYIARTRRSDQLPSWDDIPDKPPFSGGDTEIRTNADEPLRVEVRTDDPVNPKPGRIWYRIDLE